MDYMSLVTRSFKNAFKLKYLWLFGFFVSASEGFSNWNLFRKEFGGKWAEVHQTEFLALVGIMVLIIMGVVLIFWLLKVLAEGSLIHGIVYKEESRPATFSDCWGAGVRWFGRLLAIELSLTVVSIALVLVMIAMLVPLYLASLWAGVLTTIVLAPLAIVVLFILVATKAWAIRLGILHNLPWFDAMGAGWRLLKRATGRTIGVAFSSFLSQLAMQIVMLVGLAIIAIPFVVLGLMNLWLGLIPGILVGLVILVFASSVIGVFSSSVWTIGFVELTGYKLSPAFDPEFPSTTT